jgi:diguanylate cyclase (GGDEF)-like protein
VSPSGVRRPRVGLALDVLIFVLGMAVAIGCLTRWLTQGQAPGLVDVVATALIVAMCSFPLVLTQRSGDVVIGFESCALVFIVLTEPPTQALGLWSIAMVIGHGSSRKSWRSRIFNVGLTILGGGLLVATVATIDPTPGQKGVQLFAVMLGCALYFLYDLLVTAGCLAIEDGTSIWSALRWRSVPLGLACFVSVDTLGYLAALLERSQPDWTLLLLLVPVGTILVAIRSVSRDRLAQRRLSGLLEAATQAPEWSDEAQIETALLVQAERTLRHTAATLRLTPAVSPEVGVPVEIAGRPTRHLVVRRQASGEHFDSHDLAALEALAAVGVAALHRRKLADQMSYLAQHDVLTGLHNRAVFAGRLARALERRGPSGLVAVLYCDLDGFKEVNDLLGHDIGDRLLVSVGRRVLACLRPEDTAARLGGDEFGILLDDLADAAQAELVAERVLESLTSAFQVGEHEIRVEASIGIAYAGDDPVSAEVLLNRADTAMYAAKALGKGRAERFVPEMRTKDLNRMQLEAALREAIREDQIEVYYQPIVDLHTGRIDGFEALARWTHATLGAVPPDTFIPIAERLGLIRPLGLQILERAYRGAVQLCERAGRGLSLSVNLSATQVTDHALAERVEALRRQSPQVNLVLELTEGTLLGEDAATAAALRRLKASGALLAIDDFGVGYSSVGYLHRLPVDILKIDKLFVQQLHDPRSHALVHGIVAMASAMHLPVVTEGVENWATAITVRDLGCNLAQGYLFSPPVDLAVASALAAAGRIDLSQMSAGNVSVIAGR